MFRPQNNFNIKSSIGASPTRGSRNLPNTSDSPQSTIREIRSRIIASTSTNNARQLLPNRRQAMSMERLNGSMTNASPALHSGGTISEKGKSSPTTGSTNSISGSTASSPSRSSSTNGLNRTASRASRFRSAKAVFEKLSNANNNNATSISRPLGADKPRGTVASRYAAAAAARAQQHSPKTRLNRSNDFSRSSSNTEINRFPAASSNSPTKHDINQPKPQPRIITTTRSTIPLTTAVNQSNRSSLPKLENDAKSRPIMSSSSPSKSLAQTKPPPRDLIDKIVLEIALDAGPIGQNADCTIQNLSDCNISGIPETLDFDRCFQDVEMMTEEEARQLLSKKSDEQLVVINDENIDPSKIQTTVFEDSVNNQENVNQPQSTMTSRPDEIPADDHHSTTIHSNDSLSPSNPSGRFKVRFSDEPVRVYDTHAVEDYDRRNDDIDPVAASAEYELEKSRERAGLCDEDDSVDVGAVKISGIFNDESTENSDSNAPNNQSLIGHHDDDTRTDLRDSSENACATPMQKSMQESNVSLPSYSKDYIDSLEREVRLKRILEQNLRDLQSQYYEAVKELDEQTSKSNTKIEELRRDLIGSNGKNETVQSELSELRQQYNLLEKELNDIKESSQLLEKKYHRAKRIIKDMQSREESFTRREQLYHQKLDEIEHELGVLIGSVERTIQEDALKFYSLVEGSTCLQQQHQTRLDVFGLIKQMLDNFNNNQSTQNPQIKQRIVTILEQQLASLMVSSTEGTYISGISTTNQPNSSIQNSQNHRFNQNLNSNDGSKNGQSNHAFASHRLSQPNLPYPVGVGGQPTKIFHGLNPAPITVSLNEPSPPQSVNSYPSSNSLNSLNYHLSQQNNNNNNNATNNNHNSTKQRDAHTAGESQVNSELLMPNSTSLSKEESFQAVPDIQVPYQSEEWHEKPVSEWTTHQVSTWLLALGLDQYISKFEDRNVNGQSLINLDSTVLKGLGVLNSNDRNLLKKKIRELRVEMEKERKLVEKKLKENLKDKSKMQLTNQTGKSSWKKGLLP